VSARMPMQKCEQCDSDVEFFEVEICERCEKHLCKKCMGGRAFDSQGRLVCDRCFVERH